VHGTTQVGKGKFLDFILILKTGNLALCRKKKVIVLQKGKKR
jgi:hypothetical protein